MRQLLFYLRGVTMNKAVRMLTFLGSICLFLAGLRDAVFCENNPVLRVGDCFPKLILKAPGNPFKNYLGLRDSETFTLNEVKADLIVVEVMNMYCHSCRAKAPVNNRLFSLIQADPELKDRLKMLAIAVGSTERSIQPFRDEFESGYPIIPDPEFKVYKAIGGGGVPRTFYVRNKAGKQRGGIAGIHAGTGDSEKLLNEIKEIADADISRIEAQKKTRDADPKTTVPEGPPPDLEEKIRAAFIKQGEPLTQMEKVLPQYDVDVYTQKVRSSGSERRIFAVSVDRTVPCDVCHDLRFIYLFDETGCIIQLIPLQLTKYGNKAWNDQNIEKMRQKFVGRYLNRPFEFDPRVDAVSHATITSSMIFKSLNEGIAVYNALKAKHYP